MKIDKNCDTCANYRKLRVCDNCKLPFGNYKPKKQYFDAWVNIFLQGLGEGQKIYSIYEALSYAGELYEEERQGRQK